MTNEIKIGMHRLNQTHKVDDEVFMGFFSPTVDYYDNLQQDKDFKLFLTSDCTTKEGQDRIAEYYQVEKLWGEMKKNECHYERYFQLLWLVKPTVQLIFYGSALSKDYIDMLQSF